MSTISEETRQDLIQKSQEAERLQKRADRVQEIADQANQAVQLAFRAVVQERGLDPDKYRIDLQTGMIEEQSQHQRKEMPEEIMEQFENGNASSAAMGAAGIKEPNAPDNA